MGPRGSLVLAVDVAAWPLMLRSKQPLSQQGEALWLTPGCFDEGGDRADLILPLCDSGRSV